MCPVSGHEHTIAECDQVSQAVDDCNKTDKVAKDAVRSMNLKSRGGLDKHVVKDLVLGKLAGRVSHHVSHTWVCPSLKKNPVMYPWSNHRSILQELCTVLTHSQNGVWCSLCCYVHRRVRFNSTYFNYSVGKHSMSHSCLASIAT